VTGSEGRVVSRNLSSREASAPDIEACVALALLAAPGSDAASWNESLSDDIESPERRLVVAECSGGVIGYGRVRFFEPESGATADTAPRGYYLMGIVVRPDHRRAGVATAITRARLDWIAERKDEVWYFANARNTASIRLHEQFGFEEVTRGFSFPGVMFNGGEGILFRLLLSN
jgi:ribosomal protein S18 acetylase RimI-like enzyme